MGAHRALSKHKTELFPALCHRWLVALMARMNQQDLGLTGTEAYAERTKPAGVIVALLGVAELSKSDLDTWVWVRHPQKYLQEGF